MVAQLERLLTSLLRSVERCQKIIAEPNRGLGAQRAAKPASTRHRRARGGLVVDEFEQGELCGSLRSHTNHLTLN